MLPHAAKRFVVFLIAYLADFGNARRAQRVSKVNKTNPRLESAAALILGLAKSPRLAFGSVLPPLVAFLSNGFRAVGYSGRYSPSTFKLCSSIHETIRPMAASEVPSFNAAILGCGKGGLWRQALSLLADSYESQVMPDVSSCDAAVSVCASCDQGEEVYSLVSEMLHQGLVPSLTSFNAAIQACSKDGDWVPATALLNVMQNANVKPNVISFNAAIAACEKSGKWMKALSLLDEIRFQSLMPNMNSFNTAISACKTCGQWQQALALMSRLRSMGISPNTISFNLAISACEKGSQWERAQSLINELDEQFQTEDLDILAIVNSTDEWNMRAEKFYPNQTALHIHQLDFSAKNANPFLVQFWKAVRDSLDATLKGGSKYLYKTMNGSICKVFNDDFPEQWLLAAQDEGGANLNIDEFHEGVQSSEIPIMTDNSDIVVRIPAKLLNAFKSEILQLMLGTRTELGTILEHEKQKGKQVEVKWEHKVLRRYFDGEFANHQPDLRFHRDTLPVEVDARGVLCCFTVLTVLDNYDPTAKEGTQENSIEQAGTIFKLDAQFGSEARADVPQTEESFSAKPKQGERYIYWYSRSNPGTATIFNNFYHSSPWTSEGKQQVTIEHSWTPQMTHSIAKVKRRVAKNSDSRSRTILFSKVTFCSSPAASGSDELVKRIKSIGLGQYLANIEGLEELRVHEGHRPSGFDQFLNFYGDPDLAEARWKVAEPAVVNLFSDTWMRPEKA